MTERYEYGEPDRYEITWQTGHVETIEAHQVSWPSNGQYLLGGMFGSLATETRGKPKIQFHAEIESRWCLVLSAHEEDIRTIRRVTDAERIPVSDERVDGAS